MAATSKVQLFTFRTFPKDLIDKHLQGFDVFIFGKLKEDLNLFEQHVKGTGRTRAIGFAVGKASQQEVAAINVFNGGKVNRTGPDQYKLDPIDSSSFPLATRTTTSFCNYTAYNVASFIPTSFIHVRPDDFALFARELKSAVKD